MTKQELLNEIESKALKVVATTEEADSVKNAASVKVYITHVIEQDGEKVTGRNIGWYTIDEGTAQEQAFYRDVLKEKNQARSVVIAYLDGLTPRTYIRYTLDSVDEQDRSARARAIKDNGNGTATEVNLFVYKNGSNPIKHIELTQ